MRRRRYTLVLRRAVPDDDERRRALLGRRGGCRRAKREQGDGQSEDAEEREGLHVHVEPRFEYETKQGIWLSYARSL